MYTYSFNIQLKFSFSFLRIGVLYIIMIVLLGCENSSGVKNDEPESEPEPSIESIEPNSGMVGTQVLIKGSNFGQDLDEVTVNFNGTEAELTEKFSISCESTIIETLTVSLRNKIVFINSSDRLMYAVNPDGTELTQISSDGASNPDISPDGEAVIYSGIEKLTPAGIEVLLDGSMPSWSPDGSKIAYVSSENTINAMNADGSNIQQLTQVQSSFDLESPVWSPDGEHILFRCDQPNQDLGLGNGANQLCMINTDGSDYIQLTNNGYTYNEPSWSPDGTQIAFHGYLDDNSGQKTSTIFVMDADGSNVVQLIDGEGYRHLVSGRF